MPKRSSDELQSQQKKKRIVILFVLMLVAAGLVYGLVYAPIFKIEKIAVSGTRDPDLINRLQMITLDETRGHSYVIWPRNNILFLNKEKLKARINLELVLDRLEIDRQLLHTLKIEVEEKIPVLLWQEKEDLYYIDRSGLVMGAVSRDEVAYDLPLVGRPTSSLVILNEQLLDGGDIEFIRQVLAETAEIFSEWTVERVTVERVSNDELYFYSSQGWYYILARETDIERDLTNLDRLIKQEIGQTDKLEYVDLRLPDRIFYKSKEES